MALTKSWKALSSNFSFRCREFLSDESGQSIVEYVLLLSVVLVGAGAMGRGMMRAFDRGILTFGGALEKHLKTGRAPLNVWKN